MTGVPPGETGQGSSKPRDPAESSLGPLSQFGELMLNCVRILAKLSLYEDCRRVMAADTRAVQGVFELLAVHGRSQPLVVRVCFVLGNLTSRSEQHRELIAGRDNHGVDTLLGLLFDYSLVDEALWEQQEDSAAAEYVEKEGKVLYIFFSFYDPHTIIYFTPEYTT